jgi:hypothetical protein
LSIRRAHHGTCTNSYILNIFAHAEIFRRTKTQRIHTNMHTYTPTARVSITSKRSPESFWNPTLIGEFAGPLRYCFREKTPRPVRVCV